jgi:hypothetical protein
MPNLNPAPKKPHMAGILSALITLSGIITTAAGYVTTGQQAAQASGVHLPGWVAATGIGLTVVGGTLQAVTKGVQHGDTDLVPKSN